MGPHDLSNGITSVCDSLTAQNSLGAGIVPVGQRSDQESQGKLLPRRFSPCVRKLNINLCAHSAVRSAENYHLTIQPLLLRIVDSC